jgi:hypothetical protein
MRLFLQNEIYIWFNIYVIKEIGEYRETFFIGYIMLLNINPHLCLSAANFNNFIATKLSLLFTGIEIHIVNIFFSFVWIGFRLHFPLSTPRRQFSIQQNIISISLLDFHFCFDSDHVTLQHTLCSNIVTYLYAKWHVNVH